MFLSLVTIISVIHLIDNQLIDFDFKWMIKSQT